MDILINYRILAFGKAGSSIVKKLVQQKYKREQVFYFDTDGTELHRNGLENRYLIGGSLLKEKGTKGDVKYGREAFIQDKELFDRLTEEDCVYVIIGGFGGGTFTGMVAELVKSLVERDKRCVVVASMPPEDYNKANIASMVDILREINQYTDKVVLISQEQVRAIFNSEGKLQGYDEIDSLFVHVITSIFSSTSPDIIMGGAKGDLKMHDAVIRIKAYVHDNQLFVAKQDTNLILTLTHQALLNAIDTKPDLVHSISPRKFEELIAYIYGKAGYTTELTDYSKDEGVDVKVWSMPALVGNPFYTIVQAKQRKRDPIGVKEVHTLKGTSDFQKADRAVLVTTTTFTKGAIETARDQKIDLIRFYELAEELKKSNKIVL